MATVTARSVIATIIAGNGHYSDDPPVVEIVEFEARDGRTCWGFTWETEHETRQHRYRQETETVRNPRVIWPVAAEGPLHGVD